jgi:hypothetical protein
LSDETILQWRISAKNARPVAGQSGGRGPVGLRP